MIFLINFALTVFLSVAWGQYWDASQASKASSDGDFGGAPIAILPPQPHWKAVFIKGNNLTEEVIPRDQFTASGYGGDQLPQIAQLGLQWMRLHHKKSNLPVISQNPVINSSFLLDRMNHKIEMDGKKVFKAGVYVPVSNLVIVYDAPSYFKKSRRYASQERYRNILRHEASHAGVFALYSMSTGDFTPRPFFSIEELRRGGVDSIEEYAQYKTQTNFFHLAKAYKSEVGPIGENLEFINYAQWFTRKYDFSRMDVKKRDCLSWSTFAAIYLQGLKIYTDDSRSGPANGALRKYLKNADEFLENCLDYHGTRFHMWDQPDFQQPGLDYIKSVCGLKGRMSSHFSKAFAHLNHAAEMCLKVL